MAYSHREIGIVEKNPTSDIENGQVQFDIPYRNGNDTYRITLNDEELEEMYQKGVNTLLAKSALDLFALTQQIRLPSPELPLLICPQRVALDMELGAEMTAYVVTQSEMSENYHRGNLQVLRKMHTDKWKRAEYKALPPLPDLDSLIQ